MSYGVDLYWLPLGAGGHSVRLQWSPIRGAVAAFEREGAMTSTTLRRGAGAKGPVRDRDDAGDGRVAERATVRSPAVRSGAAVLGWSTLFRYEVRRWLGGEIPMSPRRSRARGRSQTTRSSHSVCSIWCRSYRRRPGVATSSAPARCGTRTRSAPGCSSPQDWTSRRFRFPLAAARRAGTQESPLRAPRRPSPMPVSRCPAERP